MKTKESILLEFKANTLDGRDAYRLSDWLTVDECAVIGVTFKDGADLSDRVVRPWTEEAFREQLASDLDFAFEKALNKRGISASLMHAVIKMWMWVLEDDLQRHEGYAQYGLPLFKAVALKYGLPNPIGDDTGTEYKYSTYGD